jgi:hypothetical protein
MKDTNWLLTWDIPPSCRHCCTKYFYNRPPSCWGYESTRMRKTLSTQFPLISQKFTHATIPITSSLSPFSLHNLEKWTPSLQCNPSGCHTPFPGLQHRLARKISMMGSIGMLNINFHNSHTIHPPYRLGSISLAIHTNNMKVERWME